MHRVSAGGTAELSMDVFSCTNSSRPAWARYQIGAAHRVDMGGVFVFARSRGHNEHIVEISIAMP